jgi:hypothetical protein
MTVQNSRNRIPRVLSPTKFSITVCVPRFFPAILSYDCCHAISCPVDYRSLRHRGADTHDLAEARKKFVLDSIGGGQNEWPDRKSALRTGFKLTGAQLCFRTGRMSSVNLRSKTTKTGIHVPHRIGNRGTIRTVSS